MGCSFARFSLSFLSFSLVRTVKSLLPLTFVVVVFPFRCDQWTIPHFSTLNVPDSNVFPTFFSCMGLLEQRRFWHYSSHSLVSIIVFTSSFHDDWTISQTVRTIQKKQWVSHLSGEIKHFVLGSSIGPFTTNFTSVYDMAPPINIILYFIEARQFLLPFRTTYAVT